MQVGAAQQAGIGAQGMAWGLGLQDMSKLRGDSTADWDYRSPAGIFRIVETFGTKPYSALAPLKIQYREIRPDTICVDDPSSRYYNRIIEERSVPQADWRSGERMIDPANGYSLGVAFSHNLEPVRSGRGSCIYIHVGGGPTAGCTVIPEPELQEILGWLDRRKDPLLVQLPQPVYDEMKPAWGLP
jgi:L,D-peptidoglycan transpeptidase YkuD (ErfK/YbiS/YcfS/YnhG family)